MILTRTHTLVSPHQYVCCGKKCRWEINNKKKGMLQLYTLHVFAFLFLPFCDLTALCGKEQSRLKIPFLSTWTAAFWKDKHFLYISVSRHYTSINCDILIGHMVPNYFSWMEYSFSRQSVCIYLECSTILDPPVFFPQPLTPIQELCVPRNCQYS